jgi:hypothetical protein
MINILHVFGCCGRGFHQALALKTALDQAGLPSELKSENGRHHRDKIDKFYLDKKTRMPLVIIDNELAVNCKDLTKDYIAKLVTQLRGTV